MNVNLSVLTRLFYDTIVSYCDIILLYTLFDALFMILLLDSTLPPYTGLKHAPYANEKLILHLSAVLETEICLHIERITRSVVSLNERS